MYLYMHVYIRLYVCNNITSSISRMYHVKVLYGYCVYIYLTFAEIDISKYILFCLSMCL